MSRALPAALALLVAACAAEAPPPAAPAAPRPCRIGPDGGPPVETASDDRGIGGTGIRVAEEDRGIGGTGIVGVVTGFASICVNGLHVAYDPALPVTFGEVAGPPSGLRVGQVVAVSAADRGGAYRARSLAVRYEVSGPVEAVEAGALKVAGQRVTVPAGTPGGTGWRVGDPVLVSGLRAPDGSIAATRIDPRPPGAAARVVVHGELNRRDGVLAVGNLPIRPSNALLLPDPGPVIATGTLENGVLVPGSVEPDMLLRDPSVWFGPGYGRFLYEGYVSLGAGTMALGPALTFSAPSGMAPFGARRGVMEITRGADGRLGASGFDARMAPGGGFPGAWRGEIAPMPGRGGLAPGGAAGGIMSRRDAPPGTARPGRGERGRGGPDAPSAGGPGDFAPPSGFVPSSGGFGSGGFGSGPGPGPGRPR
ncbi:DUF5666 domain-containing protein [Roseococcus sp. YIM B11640]|uniref:DUF5666 domain-containing protein n=1 Tax=Roseococcus sp. YIM B11640 TaxID=3133973 RepID=UPI003C7DC586